MSAILQADNFSTTNILDSTRLSAEAIVGATSITVENGHEFDANAYVLFGNHTDASEVAVVASRTGNSVTLSSALKLNHAAGTTLRVLFGNQIRFYRASNVDGSIPGNDAFSAIGIVTIDSDESGTVYTDTDGGSDYWYKYTFRNEVTTNETSLDNAVATRGGGVGNYTSPPELRFRAGLNGNTNISDGSIYRYQRAAQEEINSTLKGHYVVPFERPVNAIIKDITELIAGGQLIQDIFRSTSQSAAQTGKDMVTEGRTKLERIVSGSLVLLNAVSEETSLSTATSVSGWPNSTTADATVENGGSERKFFMGRGF